MSEKLNITPKEVIKNTIDTSPEDAGRIKDEELAREMASMFNSQFSIIKEDITEKRKKEILDFITKNMEEAEQDKILLDVQIHLTENFLSKLKDRRDIRVTNKDYESAETDDEKKEMRGVFREQGKPVQYESNTNFYDKAFDELKSFYRYIDEIKYAAKNNIDVSGKTRRELQNTIREHELIKEAELRGINSKGMSNNEVRDSIEEVKAKEEEERVNIAAGIIGLTERGVSANKIHNAARKRWTGFGTYPGSDAELIIEAKELDDRMEEFGLNFGDADSINIRDINNIKTALKMYGVAKKYGIDMNEHNGNVFEIQDALKEYEKKHDLPDTQSEIGRVVH